MEPQIPPANNDTNASNARAEEESQGNRYQLNSLSSAHQKALRQLLVLRRRFSQSSRVDTNANEEANSNPDSSSSSGLCIDVSVNPSNEQFGEYENGGQIVEMDCGDGAGDSSSPNNSHQHHESSTGLSAFALGKRKFVPSARTLGMLKRMATSVSTFWGTRLEESRSAEGIMHRIPIHSSTTTSAASSSSASNSSPNDIDNESSSSVCTRNSNQSMNHINNVDSSSSSAVNSTIEQGQGLKVEELSGESTSREDLSVRLVPSSSSSRQLHMSMAPIRCHNNSELYIPIFSPVGQLTGAPTFDFNSIFNCFDQLTADPNSPPLQISPNPNPVESGENINLASEVLDNSNINPNININIAGDVGGGGIQVPTLHQILPNVQDPPTDTIPDLEAPTNADLNVDPKAIIDEPADILLRNCSDDSVIYSPEVEAVHLQLHSDPMRLVIERRERVYAELYNIPFDFIGLKSFVVSSRLVLVACNRTNGKIQGISLGVDVSSLDPKSFQATVDVRSQLITLTASKGGRPIRLEVHVELETPRGGGGGIPSECSVTALSDEDVEVFPPNSDNVVWINLFV